MTNLTSELPDATIDGVKLPDATIDRASPVPFYFQLAQLLEEEIVGGTPITHGRPARAGP